MTTTSTRARRASTPRGTHLVATPRIETAVSLVQVNDTLWRVTRREGDVLGYIDLFHADAGPRFRARRLLSTRRTFVNDGEFWAMSDAIDCFRGR